jgi:hypothetical protein
MDDIAFDAGTDYSIVLSGLPPGCRAGLSDDMSGIELSEMASPQAGDGGGIVLRLLSPVPTLGVSLWLDAKPCGPVELSVARHGETVRAAPAR